jgi:hypothetical protein
MKTHKITFGIAALALLAATASIFAFAGCSGDDTTTTGPTRDASSDSTTKEDGGKSHKDGSSDKDSTSGDDASDETGDDAGDANDEGDVSLSTPDCGSDSSACNSCYDDAQAAANPFNACSPYTKNCVPFDSKRVPAGAVGKL